MQISNSQGSEYPYVADVDGDGSAEIVAATNNDISQGGVVFGQASGDWPAAGAIWGVQDYAETNQEDDGGVPATPPTPWELGVFRARHSLAGAPDLVVSIGPACVADCTYGPVELTVQVTNQGLRDVRPGVELQILALDSGGERVVATEILPAIPAATSLDGIEIALSPGDVGELGFAAAIDSARVARECEESNNQAEWRESFCP